MLENKALTVKRILAGFLVLTLTILIFSLIIYSLQQVTLSSSGTIVVKGEVPLTFYLDDKVTESYALDFGEVLLEVTETQYRWIFCDQDDVHIEWCDDSPTYISTSIFYETAYKSWMKWYPNSSISFPASHWLHISFKLTALSGAPQGPFNFTYYFEGS